MIDNNHNPQDKKDKSKDIDTTGHKWDDIEEYDVPAPRWWLIVWIICIIWAVIYWFFYPTWPTKSGNNKGLLNWSQQSQLQESIVQDQENKNVYLQQISKKSFQEIMKEPQLMEFAVNAGRAAFKDNCSACHGIGANGQKGFPNLNDDDWLWGGKIDDIHQTLLYGIRSGHEKARISQMPSFGLDKILTKDQINKVADYVLSLSDKNIARNLEGEAIFKANCVSCHNVAGRGDRAFGAPNLSDAIWLYGKDKEEVINTITYAHAGVMPYWQGRLDPQTIRMLAIFVHSLGGGE